MIKERLCLYINKVANKKFIKICEYYGRTQSGQIENLINKEYKYLESKGIFKKTISKEEIELILETAKNYMNIEIDYDLIYKIQATLQDGRVIEKENEISDEELRKILEELS